MNIKFCLNDDLKEQYLLTVKDYLDKEYKKCINNLENRYFKVTLEYVNEISEMFMEEKKKLEYDYELFDSRAIKYLDFIESYRLVRYQYSKYSNLHKSNVEGVYAAMLFEILKNVPLEQHHNLRIMDVGSGPSRIGYELSTIYKNAEVDLYDFSLINLFFAFKLISTKEIIKIPIRAFGDEGDIEFIELKGVGNRNVSYNVIDFSGDLNSMIEKKYDIITAVHAINLFSEPEESIKRIINRLNIGGIMVISDLMGWKEDRAIKRRKLYNNNSLKTLFSSIKGIKVLECYKGGPYFEEVNSERIDVYTNHLIVLRKEF